MAIFDSWQNQTSPGVTAHSGQIVPGNWGMSHRTIGYHQGGPQQQVPGSIPGRFGGFSGYPGSGYPQAGQFLSPGPAIPRPGAGFRSPVAGIPGAGGPLVGGFSPPGKSQRDLLRDLYAQMAAAGMRGAGSGIAPGFNSGGAGSGIAVGPGGSASGGGWSGSDAGSGYTHGYAGGTPGSGG